ncbi:hypothetical protein FOVSG1_006631 [Fusarium oxysporum f. sp. vasinfectum]
MSTTVNTCLEFEPMEMLILAGPRSFVSFCSEPGVKWIDSKVNSGDFESAATRFTTYVARMLKFSGTLSTSRVSEPPSELAMQYTKVYFEESLEQAFGIVDRPWFESKLRAHFSGAVSDDAAWYALRNVLWASGCRIMLSKTESFNESKKASQALFENAFSAHTELLYMPVSMTGLQAFILMAFYSEGVGKTSLQFMLCSNAMRLACSKDVALGYFSHVEFATDLEFSLPFARELCQYARLAVDQQHEDKQKNLINTENTAENPALVPVQAVQGTVLECAPAISENVSASYDLSNSYLCEAFYPMKLRGKSGSQIEITAARSLTYCLFDFTPHLECVF